MRGHQTHDPLKHTLIHFHFSPFHSNFFFSLPPSLTVSLSHSGNQARTGIEHSQLVILHHSNTLGPVFQSTNYLLLSITSLYHFCQSRVCIISATNIFIFRILLQLIFFSFFTPNFALSCEKRLWSVRHFFSFLILSQKQNKTKRKLNERIWVSKFHDRLKAFRNFLQLLQFFLVACTQFY